MTEKLDTITNKHSLGIRYHANPRIFDYPGAWAEQTSTENGPRHGGDHVAPCYSLDYRSQTERTADHVER